MDDFTYAHQNIGGGVFSWRIPVAPAPVEEEPRTLTQSLLIDMPELVQNANVAYVSGDIEKANAIRDEIRAFRSGSEAALFDASTFRGSNEMARPTANAALKMLSLEHETRWASLANPRTNPASMQHQAMVEGWGPQTTEIKALAIQGRDPEAMAIVSRAPAAPQKRSSTRSSRGVSQSPAGDEEAWYGYAGTMIERMKGQMSEEDQASITSNDWADLAQTGFNNGDRDLGMTLSNRAMQEVSSFGEGMDSRQKFNLMKSTMSTLGQAVNTAMSAAGPGAADDPVLKNALINAVYDSAEILPGKRIIDDAGALKYVLGSVGVARKAAEDIGKSLPVEALGGIARITAATRSGQTDKLSEADRTIYSNTRQVGTIRAGVKNTPMGLSPTDAQSLTSEPGVQQTKTGTKEVRYPKGSAALKNDIDNILAEATIDMYAGEDLDKSVLRGYPKLSATIRRNSGGKINPKDSDNLAKLMLVTTIRNNGIDLSNIAESIRRAEPNLVQDEILSARSKPFEPSTTGMNAIEAATARVKATGNIPDKLFLERSLQVKPERDFKPGSGAQNAIGTVVDRTIDSIIGPIAAPSTGTQAGVEAVAYTFLKGTQAANLSAPETKRKAKSLLLGSFESLGGRFKEKFIDPEIFDTLADSYLERLIYVMESNVPKDEVLFDQTYADLVPTKGAQEKDSLRRAFVDPKSGTAAAVSLGQIPMTSGTIPGISYETFKNILSMSASKKLFVELNVSEADQKFAFGPVEGGARKKNIELTRRIQEYAVNEFSRPGGEPVEASAPVDDSLNPLRDKNLEYPYLDPLRDARPGVLGARVPRRDRPSSSHPALSMDPEFDLDRAMNAADILGSETRALPESERMNNLIYRDFPLHAKEIGSKGYEIKEAQDLAEGLRARGDVDPKQMQRLLFKGLEATRLKLASDKQDAAVALDKRKKGGGEIFADGG